MKFPDLRIARQDQDQENRSSLPLHISLQGLLEQAAGYGIGAVINRVLGIAVACVYPMLLSKEEYGRLDVVFSLAGLISLILSLGMDAALSRFYYEHNDTAQRRGLVSAVFYSVGGFAVFASVMLFWSSKPLALWLYADPRYIPYLRLALVGIPFGVAQSIQLAVLRLERRIKIFNLIMAANLAIAAVLGISSILSFKIGAAGVLIGFTGANIATFVAGAWILRSELASAPLGGQMKKMLGIGVPLVFSGCILWLIGYVNRPILVHRVSADDLGLYAIASGGVGMLGLLIGAFRNAWQPFSFSIMGRKGSEAIYGHALTLFTAVAATIGVMGSLFAPQILLVINLYTHKNWSAAAHVIGPLALGTVFAAMYFVVQTGAYIIRRTSVLAITMGIAAFVNIFFNFLLIPRLGILGAAIATAIGYLTALVSLYIVLQRLAPIPYRPGKLAIILGSALIVIVLGSLIHAEPIGRDVATRFLILASFCGSLLVSRAITSDDLAIFVSIKRRGRKAGNETGRVPKGSS